MPKEEKYTKNLEWLVEHLKLDIEKAYSEVYLNISNNLSRAWPVLLDPELNCPMLYD